jgi:hypothetical protein
VLADTSPSLRWIGNGRNIKDNKGNVVKAYEPYFSSTPEYEDEAELVEQGVSPLMHYDPLGRLIRTDFPNGTFSRVAFTPWEQVSYDPNDTVLTSDWYASRINYAGSDVALLKEKRAAQQSAAHANTPSKVVLDSLGRPFLAQLTACRWLRSSQLRIGWPRALSRCVRSPASWLRTSSDWPSMP